MIKAQKKELEPKVRFLLDITIKTANLKRIRRSRRRWLKTTVVVDSGVYALVRHPIYLSFFLMSLSFVFISQHWLNLLLGVVVMLFIYNDMRREEKNNIEKFGDDYLRYMEQVPRMNFVLGTIRLQRRMKQKVK